MNAIIVYNFIKKRHADAQLKGMAKDPITTIFFNCNARVGCSRLVANDAKQFVQTYLLPVLPFGGTNFAYALYKTRQQIKEANKTCIVFLTDGENRDRVSNGKKASEWAYDITHKQDGSINENVKMLVAYFGTKNTSVLDLIAEKGHTTVKKLNDCHELDHFLVNVVAKQAAQFSLFVKNA